MARTCDDAHRADALAGALARQHDLNRGVNVLFWDEFIEKRDPDEQFTASDTLSLRRAAGSVSVDIFFERTQTVECFVLAHQLHQRGEDRVSGAACGRVGGFDFILELGFQRVASASRGSQAVFSEQIAVVAETQRDAINARDLIGALRQPVSRPWLLLLHVGTDVRLQQCNVCRLQMRIVGSAVPEVNIRVRALGFCLRKHFAGGFTCQIHLDASLRRGVARLTFAPIGVCRAQDVELRLRGGAEQQRDGGEQAFRWGLRFCNVRRNIE